MDKLTQPKFTCKQKRAAKRPLGILPNDRPATSGVPSSLPPITDIVVQRYVRQSAARRLLPKERVSWCLRRVLDTQCPSVLKSLNTGKTHFGGLSSCGNVWTCPVCASKVSQRRRDELSKAINLHRKNGGGLLMVTYTFAHSLNDDLEWMLEALTKAWNAVKASRSYKDLKASHGLVGTVRALENTYGINGWHPHFHEIWFMESTVTDVTMQAIKTRIFELWSAQCVKKGLGKPTEKHGIDVRDASYVSTYASKWGIEDEITKFNAKKAVAGGLSPFQLLSEYADGNKQAGALFAEYAKCFAGKRQLCWSKGLKNRLSIDEVSDEELAAIQEENSSLLGQFSLEDWGVILRHKQYRSDSRATILNLAAVVPWPVVEAYVHSLRMFAASPG